MRLDQYLKRLDLFYKVMSVCLVWAWRYITKFNALEAVLHVVLARQVVALDLIESGRIAEAAECLRSVTKVAPKADEKLVNMAWQRYRK